MSVVSSTVAIRLAGAVDPEAMAAIHGACFAKTWTAGELAQLVTAPGCLSLLASPSPERTVQGLLLVRSAGDEAEILTLSQSIQAVAARGFARALLTAAIDALREGRSEAAFS